MVSCDFALIICNLYALGKSGFLECKLSVSELADSILNYFFFLYCKLRLIHFFGAVSAGRLEEKHWGSGNRVSSHTAFQFLKTAKLPLVSDILVCPFSSPFT